MNVPSSSFADVARWFYTAIDDDWNIDYSYNVDQKIAASIDEFCQMQKEGFIAHVSLRRNDYWVKVWGPNFEDVPVIFPYNFFQLKAESEGTN